MKQQYIRPAIFILFALCGLGILLFPAIKGWFLLAFFPVFAALGFAMVTLNDDLYTHLERHFPEHYKKHRLLNSVPDIWMLSDEEVLLKLDAVVLQMIKKSKFYIYTIGLVFVLILALGVFAMLVKL